MKKRLFIKLCLILLIATACKKNNDCFTSTGASVSKTRSVQEFESVSLYDNINLILNDSAGKEILLKAGKNIIENISTETEGKSLIIKNRNTCNWLRSFKTPVTVEINIPKKSKIFIYGFGSITSKSTLNIDAINIHHYGASDLDIQLSSKYLYITTDYVGNLRVTGYAEKVECNTHKLGRVNLKELKTKDMQMYNNAEADSYISCDSILTGAITGKGNIFFTGHATQTVLESGTGSIRKE